MLCQEKTAELQKTRIKGKIATEIVPEAQWFTAEEYHQVSQSELTHSFCLAEDLLRQYKKHRASDSCIRRCLETIWE